MRRRSGFTLVEVLVAMALILFIMVILASAFSEATQTVSDLKSAGDLAERLRGAATVIHRDLEANQLTTINNGSVLPLRKLWNTSIVPNPPPPDQGYLRIFQGQPETTAAQGPGLSAWNEGADINGLPSFYQTTTCLAYTITLSGTRRNDFLSAFVPNTPLTYAADPILGPPDQRYEDTPNTANPSVYNYQSAEVVLFLVPTNDVTDASGNGALPLPLYSLCRRQFLTVPTNWTPAPGAPPAGSAQQYVEVSTIPSAGEGVTTPTFNSLHSLTMPVKRFWMNRALPGGVSQPAPSAPTTYRYATMGESNSNYQAADLLMPDVVSFDVRVLVQAPYGNAPGTLQGSDFEDLFDITNQGRVAPGTNAQWYFPYNNPFLGNPTYTNPRVFDTWSQAIDPANPAQNNYTTWQTANTPTSIPIYMDNYGNPISIKAIQITLRVWDFKTKKTRQVTIVQQM